MPLFSEVDIVVDAPKPSELLAIAEVTMQPPGGIDRITPSDDTEQSPGKSGKDPDADQAVDDGQNNDVPNVDLPAPEALVESMSDAYPPALPPSASAALDHTGDASLGVQPTEPQALVPAETVEKAARLVTAGDLGGAADREMVALVRDLVPPVADLLGQLANAYPDFSGRELSQALGMANTKLQIASGWV